MLNVAIHVSGVVVLPYTLDHELIMPELSDSASHVYGQLYGFRLIWWYSNPHDIHQNCILHNGEMRVPFIVRIRSR